MISTAGQINSGTNQVEKDIKMESDTQTFLKGQLLIAMPGLKDPNFSHTVTCLCEHSAAGAVGIVINRCHRNLTARNIFQELEISHNPDAEKIPIHIGGPVHPGELFVLHGPPFQWEASMMITPDMAMSTTRDILEATARGEGPDSFLLALGCAGWGANQLESEIMANTWLTCPMSEALVFSEPLDSRWDKVMELVGIDPIQLSDTAGRA